MDIIEGVGSYVPVIEGTGSYVPIIEGTGSSDTVEVWIPTGIPITQENT